MNSPILTIRAFLVILVGFRAIDAATQAYTHSTVARLLVGALIGAAAIVLDTWMSHHRKERRRG